MDSAPIECELRAFVDASRYADLLERFRAETEFEGESEQVTYYFDAPVDLRIQKNDAYSKIWLKKGKLHDEAREEIEVRFPAEDFPKLEALFSALGYDVQIKWFRKRLSFRLGEIAIALDDTRGYGRIVEFEKLCTPDGKEAAGAELREMMTRFGITQTPKEEFDRRYAEYKRDWRTLTGEA